MLDEKAKQRLEPKSRRSDTRSHIVRLNPVKSEAQDEARAIVQEGSAMQKHLLALTMSLFVSTALSQWQPPKRRRAFQ
jgi:hypothetical protein